MSSHTYTVMTCDRCCHEAEIRQQSDKQGWTTISAVEVVREERSRMIGTYQMPADICPGCSELLFAWWASTEAVIQPAPATAPPAARRFTIEDRAWALDEAKALLRGQVDQALDAMRDEPTSVLDGRTLPESLHGLDERARMLVDMIVERVLPDPTRLVGVAK